MTTITWNCIPLASEKDYKSMDDYMSNRIESGKLEKYIDTYLYDNKRHESYIFNNEGKITLTEFVDPATNWVYWTCEDRHGEHSYFEYVKVIQAIHIMKEDTSKIGTFILDDYRLGIIGREKGECNSKCIPDYEYDREYFKYVAIMESDYDGNDLILYYDVDDNECYEEDVLAITM